MSEKGVKFVIAGIKNIIIYLIIVIFTFVLL